MRAIGVRGVALDWFRSYLTGRYQRVRVGTSVSAHLCITGGVPQGAVLSANLFLIFINDLLTQKVLGRLSAFADEVALFYSNSDILTIWNNINEDLHTLRKWCYSNEMEINVNKTKFVNFNLGGFDFNNLLQYHSADCNDRTSQCNCQIIEKVCSFKYLGLILDESVTWEKHIVTLHRSISLSIRKFYFLRNICDPSLLRTLYFALIHSRLQYGIICWGNAFKYLLERLRTTQNHFIRIILKNRSEIALFPYFHNCKYYQSNIYLYIKL